MIRILAKDIVDGVPANQLINGRSMDLLLSNNLPTGIPYPEIVGKDEYLVCSSCYNCYGLEGLGYSVFVHTCDKCPEGKTANPFIGGIRYLEARLSNTLGHYDNASLSSKTLSDLAKLMGRYISYGIYGLQWDLKDVKVCNLGNLEIKGVQHGTNN